MSTGMANAHLCTYSLTMFFRPGVLEAAVATKPAVASTTAPALSTTALVTPAAPWNTRLMPPPTTPALYKNEKARHANMYFVSYCGKKEKTVSPLTSAMVSLILKDFSLLLLSPRLLLC